MKFEPRTKQIEADHTVHLIKDSNKGSIQSLLLMVISCCHREDFIYKICRA